MVPSVESGNQYVTERNQLQNKLLSAIKSCQSRFGGRTELATELDPCVANLCVTLEDVLCHGLRSADRSALRQVTDLVMGSGDKFTLWDTIQGLLTSHEKERYELLRQIWTNRGRGRAWLRSAINERSLVRYMTALISLPTLKSFYEDWAFVLDPELSNILPDAAAGLSSILFALSIDRPELNQAANNEDFSKSAISDTENVIEEPEPGRKKADLKKTQRVKKIISFGDEDAAESSVENQRTDNQYGTVIPFLSEIVQADEEEQSGDIECAIEATGALDLDLSNSDNESKNDNELLASNPSAGLRLLSNSTLGDLIPVSPSEDIHSSEDSISVPSFSEEGETSSTGVAVDQGPESATNDNEIPDYKMLQETLEKTQEANTILSTQLTQANMSFKQKQLQMQQKIQELQRENDALKHSLRKYVSAVQLLKQDGTEFEGEGLYQQKLVQVAEMHAELMELNDRLQRNMVSKDIIIKRLYLELEALRGPLGPTEIDVGAQIISLWVPSVFLSGSPRTHHVYQIHVRIGPVEWNVYRRYSEFYDLHHETKKLYPVISAFQFPPKKTIGNKDSKFVEERRLKLQQYLRRLVNHLVANTPQLSSSASKATLSANIPFFGESRESPSRTPSRPRPPRISNSPQYAGL